MGGGEGGDMYMFCLFLGQLLSLLGIPFKTNFWQVNMARVRFLFFRGLHCVICFLDFILLLNYMYIIMPVILLLLNLRKICCSPLDQVHMKEKAV